MFNMLRNRFFVSLLSVCLLAAVMLLISGCDQDAEQLPAYKVKGPVKVYYSYQTSEGGATSNGNTPMEAKEILLFEQYVIIKSKDGLARLIPVDKIINLNWGNIY